MTALSAENLRLFNRLQLVRIFTVSAILGLLGSIFDLGTHPLYLIAAGVFGTIRGARAISRPAVKLIIREVCIIAVVILLPQVLCSLLSFIQVIPADALYPAIIRNVLIILSVVYALCFTGTYLFWRHSGTLTAEIVLLVAGFSGLMAGHRNYHLDAPKELSNLAWKLGVESQQFFLATGVLTCCLLGIYLAAASGRPLFTSPHVIRNSGKMRKLLSFILPLFLLALLVSYARYINSRYGDELSRASEGVGEGTDEGKSPLGFHSAVGKTKQPAALVRLEGDYSGNPWAPMLYIREGALSSFNGHELVVAPKEYDSDTPRVSPGQPYISLEQDPGSNREQVVQSIFLLAKHKTALAIDFPQSMRLMKNPDTNRFTVAYQAVSFAPKVKLEELADEQVGDSGWGDETLNHYLRAPGSLDSSTPLPSDLKAALLDSNREDLRYHALEQQLVAGITAPIEKAKTIIDYLSKESIYTRQPGHQVTEGGDPVAPYLFADEKRGYCVHFAHAAVYLLRLAGIPARIGTGYLTDLTYAKDGHILLNMGDRHAWPEIYIQGFGWAIVDIQPAKAENEQVLPPDQKLLEELMNKLDPIGELTPPPSTDPSESKTSFEDQLIERFSDRGTLVSIAILLMIFFILAKLYLRFGYTLAKTPRGRALGAYRSLATFMTDLGEPRNFGETRSEYLGRLARGGFIRDTPLARVADTAAFSDQDLLTEAMVNEALKQANHEGVRAFFKRLLAFISPYSLLRWRRW